MSLLRLLASFAPLSSAGDTLPFPWRNDTANLALTAAWNDLLTATPWSLDITSPDTTDAPPVALEWSLGTDMPFAQKAGPVASAMRHGFVALRRG